MKIKNLKFIFTKHKKHVPSSIEGTLFHQFLRYGFSILFSAWFFQGILYMSLSEKVIKVLTDIVLFFVFYLFLPVWASVLLAHTLNFLLNGQFIAILTHMGIFNSIPVKYIEYTEGLHQRIQKATCIEKAIVYGSVTEGNFKKTSDLDIRIIPVNNKKSKFEIVLWAFGERMHAFFAGFPLDLYVFSLNHSIRVMKTKTPPVIFKNTGTDLRNYYYKYIEFHEFINQLKKTEVK